MSRWAAEGRPLGIAVQFPIAYGEIYGVWCNWWVAEDRPFRAPREMERDQMNHGETCCMWWAAEGRPINNTVSDQFPRLNLLWEVKGHFACPQPFTHVLVSRRVNTSGSHISNTVGPPWRASTLEPLSAHSDFAKGVETSPHMHVVVLRCVPFAFGPCSQHGNFENGAW